MDKWDGKHPRRNRIKTDRYVPNFDPDNKRQSLDKEARQTQGSTSSGTSVATGNSRTKQQAKASSKLESEMNLTAIEQKIKGSRRFVFEILKDPLRTKSLDLGHTFSRERNPKHFYIVEQSVSGLIYANDL